MYNGVTAKEVTAGRRLGVKFRQLTDGKHFIQLIYNEDNKISDCEFVHEPHSVAAFIDSFRQDIELLTNLYNTTIVPLDTGKLPKDMQQWMNYKRLKQQCKDVHRQIKKLLKDRRKTSSEENTISHRRSRRDLRQYFLLPGTLWCGHSDVAPKNTSLGLWSGTDRCCRKHDKCQHIIPGFAKKYGLVNLRPFTIVSCRCDNSFRTCLKRVGSSDANLVGKLFFNVVQKSCFVFKPVKTCTVHTWWGKCAKYKYIKQAVIKENMSY